MEWNGMSTVYSVQGTNSPRIMSMYVSILQHTGCSFHVNISPNHHASQYQYAGGLREEGGGGRSTKDRPEISYILMQFAIFCTVFSSNVYVLYIGTFPPNLTDLLCMQTVLYSLFHTNFCCSCVPFHLSVPNCITVLLCMRVFHAIKMFRKLYLPCSTLYRAVQ